MEFYDFEKELFKVISQNQLNRMGSTKAELKNTVLLPS